MLEGGGGYTPESTQEIMQSDQFAESIEKNEGLSAELTKQLEKKIRQILSMTMPDVELKGKSLPELIDMLIADNEKNFRAATYDALTDLLKKEPFTEQVKKSIGRESEVSTERKPRGGAIIFVDLNGMKQMNDALGYFGTNEVIREFAKRLEAKRSHDLVMRFGGDEFVMYMHGADPDQIGHAVLERILKSLENNPIVVEDEAGQEQKVDVTFAMGVEPVPQNAAQQEDMDQLARDLIKNASVQEKAAKSVSGHSETVLSFISSSGKQIIKSAKQLNNNAFE